MRSLISCLACLAGVLQISRAVAAEDYPEVFTRIAAIRALPRTIAAQELPVRLRAVVTYDNPSRYGPAMVEDETGGIFLAACRT